MKQVITNTKNYKFIFDNDNGHSVRFGKTIKDDPDYSPVGPEIIDMEISEICSGGCSFCYKNNTNSGKNMTIEEFKKIFSLITQTGNLTQIAFGIGDFNGNPDLLEILQYTRDNNIIPNITLRDSDVVNITQHNIDSLVCVCGAIGVSNYNINNLMTAIHKIQVSKNNHKKDTQINIHQLLSKETIGKCIKLIDYTERFLNDIINAILFLSLKEKGRAINSYTRLDDYEFDNIVDYARDKKVPFGFDSCTSHKFYKYLDNNKDFDNEDMRNLIEPCESCLFSMYIDAYGIASPCSFIGFDVVDLNTSNDFLMDVWYSKHFNQWRKQSISCDRNCLGFKI